MPSLPSKKTLAPGQVLFTTDEEAEMAYLVREGVVIVSQISSSGREAITSVFFPGEICGGFAALTGLPHTGTARAPRKSYAVVEPIRRAQLLERISQDRSLYSDLLLTQREKEKFKEEMLLRLVANSCEQRMASALLWLEQKRAQSCEEQFHLSRQELADLIGTTMETVIRVLSRFRKENLVLEENGAFILDAERLSLLAETA